MFEVIVVSAFVVLAVCAGLLRLMARMGQARDQAVEDANRLSQ